MIKINLKLFVTLSKYIPENCDCLEINDGTTIKKLMDDFNIPKDLVKLIFVNGKRQDAGYRLQQDDRVGLFPPVGGG